MFRSAHYARLPLALLLCAGPLLLSVAGEARGDNPGTEVCHAPPGNPDHESTLVVSDGALEAHLAHGDTEGTCGAEAACPCFDLGMLQALSGGSWGQQRWVEPDGVSGGNWLGISGDAFGQVLWDLDGESTCNYNDWGATLVIDYDSALACDAILNEHSLAIGAACGSPFCP